MNEDMGVYMTAPTTNGYKPLPCKAGTRSIVPSTWIAATRPVHRAEETAYRASKDGASPGCRIFVCVFRAGFRADPHRSFELAGGNEKG
jgi:hypothetical protein